MSSFTPSQSPNAYQLKLRLGTVETNCAMTAASAAFSAVGLGLTSADVGIPAMVFGAGPGGAPLITTVATRVSGNAGTLTAAASTTVTDETIIIFRLCLPKLDSLTYNTSLTVRSTLSFTLYSGDNAAPYTQQPVLLQDSILGDLFGGQVARVHTTNYPGISQTDYQVDCVGYEKLCSKRTTGNLTDDPAHPETSNPLNGQYLNLAAGSIVDYIVANNLDGDGMGSVTISGPLLNFGTQFESCAAAFDRIVTLSNTGTDKYYWYVDPWRVVTFAKQSTTAAPFSLKTSDGSSGNMFIAVSSTVSDDQIVNRPIINLGQYIADAVTETYNGDGSATQFGVSKNIAAAPTVSIDLGAGPVTQTVGVLGVDTGKDWYYTIGSNIITQDGGGVVLGLTDTISITFQGFDVATVLVQNNASVDAASARGGGTGYSESVTLVNTPSTTADATALSTSIGDNYGVLSQRAEIITLRGGLAVGQYIDIEFADAGITLATFLIDSCTMSTVDNLKRWTVSALSVAGPVLGSDWRAILGDLASGGGGGNGSSLGGSNSTAFSGSIQLSNGDLNTECAIGTVPCPIIRPLSSTPAGAVIFAVDDAPTGDDIDLTIYSAGVSWMTLTIVAGTTEVMATGVQLSGAGPLTALGIVSLALTKVGTTNPGRGLAGQIFY